MFIGRPSWIVGVVVEHENNKLPPPGLSDPHFLECTRLPCLPEIQADSAIALTNSCDLSPTFGLRHLVQVYIFVSVLGMRLHEYDCPPLWDDPALDVPSPGKVPEH